jgi:hypothetical protein
MRIVRHVEGAFELAELHDAVTVAGLFLYVKDSMTILEPDTFWATVENVNGPAWLFSRPSCYLAVYESESLRRALRHAPHTGSKYDSIHWESQLHDLLPYPTLWPDVSDWTAKRIDLVDGHHELIVGNNIVEKAKGTANCGRCPHMEIPGLCDHYLALFS